ncbi:hypothetical protein TanjilG_31376 [Lupinus angustifolius]|uniref:Uncharacterized protein n=1 Tax=Lupinus angustifolius TaxID=3871 RepID=A0A394DE41_LUPAN|nr:hypothetical protein TanjilG_31376 [Lupinus angustifolius]
MDAIGISRKRKSSSSSRPHPLSTPLTRSKSQIFLHRNRSGHLHYDSHLRPQPYAGSRRSRSSLTGFGSDDRKRLSEDGGGSGNVDAVAVIEDLRKKEELKLEPFGEGSSGEDLCCLMIKYLRLRRVYSPQSSTHACSEKISPVENSLMDSDVGDQKIGELGFGESIVEVENRGDEKEGFKVKGNCDMNADDEISMRIVDTESPNLGLLREDLNFNKGNSETSNESRKLHDEQCDGKNGGSCSEKVEDLDEELVVTTPPDAKIYHNSEVNGDEGKHIEEVRVEDTFFVGNAEKHVGKDFCPKDDDSQRNVSVLKGKYALRPCSQEKLFKIPGAVSYKRMFPFLREIMGDDFGTSKMGYCQENEKGINGGQEFQLTLSSQSKKEGSKCELKTDSCTLLDTSQPEASEGDAVIMHIDELSHGNTSKLKTKEVTTECFSVPSLNNICLSESKAGPNADFHSVSDGGHALLNDDFKHDSNHKCNLGHALPTNHGGHNSEQFAVLNEECILRTPPDVVIRDNPKVNLCQLVSMPQDVHHVNRMGLTSIPENAEDFFVTYDERKDSAPKSKSVPGPNLNRKLFKAPGSISFRRMLPFLKDLTKDDSGREASIDEHKTYSGPTHGTIKCNALVNNVLVDPANEISHGNQPQLTPSPSLPESSVQLDAKVVHELSASSLSEHIKNVETGSKDICLSDSKFDLRSVMAESQCVKKVANDVQNDGFEPVQNKIYRQNTSESKPEAQNLLYIHGDICSLASENCSSKEIGLTMNCHKRKQFEGVEKHESFIRNPTEGHAIIRRDNAVVSNHVSVLNEESSDKNIYEKSNMPKHGNVKAENDLNAIVYGPRVLLKGSNKSASRVREIRNGSKSKTTMALNRCSQVKLLKHDGSFGYKRMLPFILNTMKDTPCVSAIDHYPKLQKCLDQTSLLPISASDLQVTPISGSNGCIPRDDRRRNSGTQHETGSHTHDSNNKNSSPISQIPESQSSHYSCEVIQLQDEQVVLNRCCNLESSPDPIVSVHKINSPVTPVKRSNFSLISSNGKKTPETQGYCQILSQQKVLEQLRVKKGILKRNPRGCRGLCTCLNCVSFRLHAERAFEFSRNQFLEAEEVTVDLINELSHLRNMLERSADRVNGNPVFDGSQVEKACEKAFATEQLAKDRLSQMNDDLNIHCRIKVMFLVTQ